MAAGNTGSPGGPGQGKTSRLVALANAWPATPSVVAVALATAGAVVVFPSSAASVGATAITTVSVTLAALALYQTEPINTRGPERDSDGPPMALAPPAKDALLLLGPAIAVGCTAPAFDHLSSAVGSVGKLAALVAAAATVTIAALTLLRGAASAHSPPPTRPAPALSPGHQDSVTERYGPGEELESWTIDSLCRGWKLSFLALRTTSDAPARARVIERRRRYLDELARRDPPGFRRWVSTDAYPVSGHPEHFIAGSPSPPPVGPGPSTL